MRWGNEWSQAEVDAYLRDFKAKARPAGRAAKLESNPRHAAKKKNAVKEAHPRYRLSIGYASRKIADPGNRCHKFAIDGLVQAGVLGDDTWEWITEIKETEEKGAVEQTVIELWQIIEK